MNLSIIKEKLSDDVDLVIRLLESVGFQNIKYNANSNYLSFPRIYGDNQNATVLYLDTFKVLCFTNNNESGDLFSVIMREKNLSFPQALKYISKICDIDVTESKYRPPFNGFYKKLIREMQEPETSMQTYGEDILREYSDKFNTMFFNDGISYETQAKFNVGYDLWTNRITVPEYTLDGKLCGIMGRSIDTECPKEERWLPIIPCSRSLTLYGYHTNYGNIQNKNLCIVGESEKFPQQLDSFGCYLGLASCGCHLSDTQAKYIKGLLVDKTILAYDEGLTQEYIHEEAKKLKVNNAIFSNKVGYIFDKEHIVLPIGSKASPSDFGREAFSYLIKNCVVWI